MMNFEKIPSTPEPERKEGDAENIAARLVEHLYTWRRLYAKALVFSTAAALDFSAIMLKVNETEKKEKPPLTETVPSLDVDMRFDELRALDPEASPERVRLIIETLPEGYVGGDVASIGFTDERYSMQARYGDKLINEEAAGTAAAGRRMEKTTITFWQGAKEETSDQLWNGTLLHEIAHANDWENDRQMDLAERAELKARIVARLLSPDRYHSDYVESISNPDPQQEIDIKAKEYWAEINEAYLSGELDERTDPFNADFELVKEFIAKQDPNFDRDEALARRRMVTKEMASEEASEEYQELPQEERASIDAWMEWRAKLELAPTDPETQRAGRKEVVDLFKHYGATKEGQWYVICLAQYYGARQELFEERLKSPSDDTSWLLKNVAGLYQTLDEAAEEFGPEAEEVRGELEDIMLKQGVWMGGFDRQMEMLPFEEATLFSEKDAEAWLPYNIRWQPSSSEQFGAHYELKTYLDRKIFMIPEPE